MEFCQSGKVGTVSCNLDTFRTTFVFVKKLFITAQVKLGLKLSQGIRWGATQCGKHSC